MKCRYCGKETNKDYCSFDCRKAYLDYSDEEDKYKERRFYETRATNQNARFTDWINSDNPVSRDYKNIMGSTNGVAYNRVFGVFKKLEDKARDIQNMLSRYMPVVYDDTGSIGKRYRRQDAVGTPFCITVDFDSLEDNQVTIRERDSMSQIRIPITDLVKYLGVKVFY